jgi:hypothetical protein
MMTAHLHSEYVEGCYRCDLSRDEVVTTEAITGAEILAAAKESTERVRAYVAAR